MRHKDLKPPPESNGKKKNNCILNIYSYIFIILIVFIADICKSCCKLKKKNHYHCDICNQAFVDQTHLVIHQQDHSNPQTCENVDDEVVDYTKSEDLSIKKFEIKPEHMGDERLGDLAEAQNLSIKKLETKPDLVDEKYNDLISIQNTVTKLNGNGPHIGPKEEQVPEDLTQNCKNAKPLTEVQPPVFDQHLADYLNYQKMQFYLHNYYQFVNQQMLTQAPPSQIRAEFPFLPEPSPNTEISNINNGQSPKRPAPEAENEDSAPNFKKIKIRKFSELADTSNNGSFTDFRPISTPNIVESSPILNQKLISSNFPMVQHLINQDIQAVNKPKNNRMFKDEPVPKGYLKFKFNEDCNFMNCGYRNHQSHFHCIRYSFYYFFQFLFKL